MSERVPVNPAMLEWALNYAYRTPEEAAKKFKKFDAWINDELNPTAKQVKDFAKWTHISPALLFLSEPPAVELPIADFRSGPVAGQAPSAELIDTIASCQRRQDWFIEYAEQNEIQGFNATRIKSGSSTIEVAELLRNELNYEVEQRAKLRTPQDARRYLIDSFEDLGGLVVVNSVVGYNNSRPLDREEFRGFTLASPVAPLIFVNSRDSFNGQIFTLAHEFAHVWAGDTGVSVDRLGAKDSSDKERWCNGVAADFLVPANDINRMEFRENNFDARLDDAKRRYMCSTLVIIIRLKELGILGSEFLDRAYVREEIRLKELAERSKEGSGGSFYNNVPLRVGRRLLSHLALDVRNGGTSYTEGMRLTGVNRLTFGNLLDQRGAA